MISLYRFGYILYKLAAICISPFNAKAAKWVRGRRHIQKDLGGINPGDKIIWLHAASVGEYEMGRPVMQRLKTEFPDYKILVTFFSPSGYDHLKEDPLHDFCCYLPHDTPKATRRFLDIARPAISIFIKYEFWPTLIRAALKREIPVCLISATFREKQFVFTSLGAPLRKLLQQTSAISVQDAKSRDLLMHKGFTNVTLTGDGRFDNVTELAKKEYKVDYLERFIDHRPVLVAGSCWPEDEDIVLPQIMRQTQMVFILVPHDVSPSNIRRLTSRLPASHLLWSKRDETSNPEDYRILIVDTVGELRAMYSYADVAFVGGGFKTGLHNILEPASYGKAVFFGPKHHKFWEAKALIEAGGAVEIHKPEDLNTYLEQMASNRKEIHKMGTTARGFTEENTGAGEAIAGLIRQFLK